jgi:site-specific DNA-methyltransferase (adenine-specific)
VNKLYFGDCLDILKKLHHEQPQGFIDLIYIDPPFNSKRNYNILFESADLKDTKAQKEAFADTWSNISYKDTLEEIKEIDLDLFKFLEGLDSIRISKSAVSYLTTMAIRIHYMHKVLKDTGSFYLHCDPTMSHYLKLVCDLIFGNKNFRNEIIWYYGPKATQNESHFQRKHDIVFFYSKKDSYQFNVQIQEYSEGSLAERDTRYKFKDGDGVYRETTRRDKNGQKYRAKVYLKEGVAMTDVWDISIINATSKERLGYPTQKPEALLERIIEASSDKGDLVADFFCGCGTTISVAQALKRKWLGADISHLAIGLIERRLIASYGKAIKKTYEIDGLPKDLASAKKLAEGVEHGRLKFQDWIIETMIGGVHNPKKTADGGWDGHLTFDHGGKKEVVLIEVKSGHVNVKNVREFIQVVRKQQADIGVFVCFKDQVTKPMQLAAKEEGYYRKETWGDRFDKMQILTVEQLLEGEGIKFPLTQTTTVKTAVLKNEKIDHPELF